MNAAQWRRTLRYTHLAIAALVTLFIYVPPLRANGGYELLVQVVVLPVVILTGLAMWQQGRIRKWFARS